jgi:ElaB/YqjD/DUF883 family membrane-anchored ribosome-binding protein
VNVAFRGEPVERTVVLAERMSRRGTVVFNIVEALVPVDLLAPDMLKAKQGALGKMYSDPEGAFHWITVKPHGDDGPGQHVKVRESKTEPGVFHVVAGAGGSLNYLKLTNLRSPEEQKQREKEKAAAKKQAEGEKRDAERERKKALSPEEKEAEAAGARRQKAVVDEAHTLHEARRREFVANVAQALGWKDEEWKFDETAERLGKAGASKGRIEQQEKAHFKRVEQRAQDVLAETKRVLVADAEARRAAGLGDIPLESNDPNVVALSDLEEQKVKGGLGFKSPTRDASDEEIAAHLAARDTTTLQRELELAIDRAAKDGSPDAIARVKDLTAEKRAAELIAQAATAKPEDVEQGLQAVAEERQTVVEGMRQYVPELRALESKRGEGATMSPREETLALELAQDQAHLEAIEARKSDLTILSGEMGPALKGERGAISAKRVNERYDELLESKGQESAEAYLAAREGFIAAGKRYQDEVRLYKETGVLRKPELEVKPILDSRKAIELIAADKALRADARKLAAADAGVEAGEDVDEQVFGRNMFTGLGPQPSREAIAKAEKDIENEVMARRNQAFLDRVESPDLLLGRGKEFTEDYDKKDLHRSLEQHLGAGAYNALNNASLAYAKSPLLSREVVDTLGARGAAELLAWKMRQLEDPSTLREMATRLGEYHAEKSADEVEEAMREIEEDLDRADEVLQQASSPSDLAVLQEARAKRQEALEEARQRAGQTLGEFEATAGLVDALGKKGADSISVNFGEIGSEAAIRQLRALGLDRSDYTIDTDGKNFLGTVHASGFEKLVGQVNPERMKLQEQVIAIKKGEHDEPDWKPKGTISRAATTFDGPGLEPASLTTNIRPFQKFGDGGSVADHVNEHIARHAANGEPLDNVLRDMNDSIMSVPAEHRAGYGEALEKAFPTRVPLVERGKPVLGEDGKPKMRLAKASDHAAAVDRITEEHFRKVGAPDAAPINSQGIRYDSKQSQEAITRALASDPRRMVAFKPLGELTGQDQRALRGYFDSHVAKGGGSHVAAAGDTTSKERLGKHLAEEPAKTTPGLFGGGETTPEWLEWDKQRKELEAAGGAGGPKGPYRAPSGPGWNEYTAAMGGVHNAYTALQDRLKSDFVKDFHQAYTMLHDEPLRIGIRPAAHGELHLGFLDPAKREALLTERRRILDAARNRVGGKYSAGSASERMERIQQAEEIERQNQMGLLGGSTNAPKRRTPDGHERYTLGNRAEAELAAALPSVAKNWRPGSPVELLKDRRWSDSEGAQARLIHQQRTVKSLLATKRLAGALGTGSGKSSVGVGAFSHLLHTPESGVKRGLFVVPPSVQGQFRGEFAKNIEPGSMNYAADPGLSREGRLAQHADPKLQATVHTHQSFRDDMVHLIAEHLGVKPEEASTHFMDAMPGKSEQNRREARAALVKEVLAKNGISYQYLMADEAHGLLDRENKPDSLVSKIMQAVSDNTPYYLSATADPVKNDVSELRSLLDKLHADGRYGDAADWKRRYGVNTTAAAEALRREVAPYVYAAEIRGNHKVNRQTITNGNPISVELHPEQAKQYAAVQNAVKKLRAARISGKVDVAAAKVLAPDRFAAAPAEQHEAIAKEIQRNPNAEHALNRVVNLAPKDQNAKIAALRQDLKAHNPKDGPAVVFAHNLKAVDEITEALAEDGHRVEKLTGGDSTKERDRKRLRFQPETGEAKADVFVVSDAAESGLNLQRGQRLYQFDRPWTAKTWAQRNGRIDRLGQKAGAIDLVDLTTNTDFEARAADRVNRKMELRKILTDPGDLVDDTGIARVFSEARLKAAERTKVAA